MPGGMPSIDKLLTAPDRYDWKNSSVNTEQESCNFLNFVQISVVICYGLYSSCDSMLYACS